MMKVIMILMLIFVSSFSFAKSQSDIPDMILASKLEKKWNIFLLDQFRQAMNNYQTEFDPLNYTLIEPIVYDEKHVYEYLSVDSIKLISELEQAIDIPMLKLRPRFQFNNLSYSIKEITPDIKVKETTEVSVESSVSIESDIQVRGLEVSGSSLVLDFVTDSKRQKGISVVEINLINPKLRVDEEALIHFFLDVDLIHINDHLHLKFPKSDFTKLNKLIYDKPELFEITYDDITITNVKLEMGDLELKMDSDKIREVIRTHQPSLQEILLQQIQELLAKDAGRKLLDIFESKYFKASKWYNTNSQESFPFYLALDKISSYQGQIRAQLNADSCTTRAYKSFGGDCLKKKEVQPYLHKHSLASQSYSKTNIDVKMQQEDIGFIASISDNYINKVIATLIENGSFDEMLDEMGLELGDKGIFFQVDRVGDSGKVYMDVVYKQGPLMAFIVGKKRIRFPVVLDIKVKIENMRSIDEESEHFSKVIPHMVFTVTDVDTSSNTLRYGIPEMGLYSNVKDVRKMLKKKVVGTIRSELYDFDAPSDYLKLQKWKGVDLPGLEFPELNKLKLDKAQIESDGHGRLNLIFEKGLAVYRD